MSIEIGVAAGKRRTRRFAVIDGMSEMMAQEITLEKGAVVQANYDEHQMVSIAEAPREIDVYFHKSANPTSGLGRAGHAADPPGDRQRRIRSDG